MTYVILKRGRSALKEKVLVRYETVKGVHYTVQCVEYHQNGRVMENVMRSYDLFGEAQDAFQECYTWLKLADRITKAEGIYKRLRSKINAYEDKHEDYAPKAWIRARNKIQRWLWSKEPKVAQRDFWDCYL